MFEYELNVEFHLVSENTLLPTSLLYGSNVIPMTKKKVHGRRDCLNICWLVRTFFLKFTFNFPKNLKILPELIR